MNQLDSAPDIISNANGSAGGVVDHSGLVDQVFGQRDTTPWGVLCLAACFGLIELSVGLPALLSDVEAGLTTELTLLGGFFGSAAIAASSLWIWYLLAGSISELNRLKMLAVLVITMLLVRGFVNTEIQSVLAIVIWNGVGNAVVVLTARHALQLKLVDRDSPSDSLSGRDQSEGAEERLTIWYLLRATLLVAFLGWFTKASCGDPDSPLSSTQVIGYGLPLGLVTGIFSYVVLRLMMSPRRLLWMPLLLSISLPLIGSLYFAFGLDSRIFGPLLLAAIVAILGTGIHLSFFCLLLVARRFRFLRQPERVSERLRGHE